MIMNIRELGIKYLKEIKIDIKYFYNILQQL